MLTAEKKRKPISNKLRLKVLTEAGYRCAVPTCKTILAIDLHHIIQVRDGGGNIYANLIALCPTCHALYHRGVIAKESIAYWKDLLVKLNATPQSDDNGLDKRDSRALVAVAENIEKDGWAYFESIKNDLLEDGFTYCDALLALHFLSPKFVTEDDEIINKKFTLRYKLTPAGLGWLSENGDLDLGG